MLNTLSFFGLNLNTILALAFSSYGGILGLIHLILWLIAAVEIFQSGKSAGNKLLWVLVILFLPVVGLILYYLIGR
ncbi:MAG: PLDc N-terminal domain-containing protein [Chitinophagales bacterium]